MVIDRRSLLAAMAVAACTSQIVLGRTDAVAAFYAGVRRHKTGRFYACLIGREGRILKEFPLPARAHGMAYDPSTARLIVFARRPGTFGMIVDVRDKRQIGSITAPTERHFYGHGVFSADGAYLYATENDYENGRGAIGVYDTAKGFRRIGEMSTGGIGPHDIALLPSGHTLVIANGGIKTHPEYPRVPLNLASMESSIAYVDATSGKLLEIQRPPEKWRQLSLRHLAITFDGHVAIGCQFKGSKIQHPPLIALHERDRPIGFTALPMTLNRSLRHYVGSIVANHSSRVIAASAPRGNKVVYLDSMTGTYLGHTELFDVCGIAAQKGTKGFLLTGANKIAISTTHDTTGKVTNDSSSPDVNWDNHLSRL